MTENVGSCRSDEGQTMGLVDGVIHIVRAIMERSLTHPDVQNSLADLHADPAFQSFKVAAQAAHDRYTDQSTQQSG